MCERRLRLGLAGNTRFTSNKQNVEEKIKLKYTSICGVIVMCIRTKLVYLPQPSLQQNNAWALSSSTKHTTYTQVLQTANVP